MLPKFEEIIGQVEDMASRRGKFCTNLKKDLAKWWLWPPEEGSAVQVIRKSQASGSYGFKRMEVLPKFE